MSKSLIAVDVGNSFLHFGRYSIDDRDEFGFPRLLQWSKDHSPLVIKSETPNYTMLRQLAAAPEGWFVCSVNRDRQTNLMSVVRKLRPNEPYHVLTRYDFQMRVDVDEPEHVGVDRLAAALAAYQMRNQAKSVIVIDAGTAITVDRVDEPGVFRGGAILPGPFLFSDALHRHTYALPLVPAPETPPSPVGKNTKAAISSGVFWGTVGAIRELVSRMRAEMNEPPEIFMTGGAAQDSIADLIGARQVPDLVLRGIALAGVPLASTHSNNA